MAFRRLGLALAMACAPLCANPAFAQDAPPPVAPLESAPPPPSAPPESAPPPAAAPYGQQPGYGQQPNYGQQPGYGQQPNYGAPPPYGAPPGSYGQDPGPPGPPPPGYGYSTEYVPPPPEDPDQGFKMPDFSVRLDPFRWVIEGELGLELEVGLWKFISLEVVPSFLVDGQPPLFNDFDGVLTQHSDGIGALTGTSVGVGFWLDGEPFRGTVLRALFATYSRTYRTKDDLGLIDEVSHNERLLGVMYGSYNRWGPFTIGGGIGLALDLNEERRCFTDARVDSATDDCDDEQLKIALDREVTETAGVYGFLHPVQFIGRISLGFVF